MTPGAGPGASTGTPTQVMPTMQKRTFLAEEHEAFRATARAFCEREVVPHHEQWGADGQVSRDVWRKAGEAGLLCFDVAEEYGGPGVCDFP